MHLSFSFMLFRTQLADLISKHKESEARRVEVEKSYQEEIMSKWKEIEEQKDLIQKLREQQEVKVEEAQQELDKLRAIFVEQSGKERQTLEKEMQLLVELKHKHKEDDSVYVPKMFTQAVSTFEDKSSISSFLQDRWSTIEQSELRLAELELQISKSLEQVEVDLTRQEELMKFDKQEELKEIDAEREAVKGVQARLSESFATSEAELKRRRVDLEKSIETGYQQLNEVDGFIRILEEQQKHFVDKAEFDPKEIKRQLLEERKTGQNRIGEIRGKVAAIDEQIQKGFKNMEKGSLKQRYVDLERELQNLCCFKQEKQESVEEAKKELSNLISNVEKSRKEIISNEERLSQIGRRYSLCQQKHEEKIETSLEALRNAENVRIQEMEIVKDACMKSLQDEYQQIEEVVSGAYNEVNATDCQKEASRHKVVEVQKSIVLSLIKNKRDRIGEGGSKNVTDYMKQRARFERDQERMLEQQNKISEHVLADIKEKESSISKLSAQRDQFHSERQKERRAIQKRIRRIERAKSLDDIQSEYTLEFYKEEANKLKEAFERVGESESRYIDFKSRWCMLWHCTAIVWGKQVLLLYLRRLFPFWEELKNR